MSEINNVPVSKNDFLFTKEALEKFKNKSIKIFCILVFFMVLDFFFSSSTTVLLLSITSFTALSQCFICFLIYKILEEEVDGKQTILESMVTKVILKYSYIAIKFNILDVILALLSLLFYARMILFGEYSFFSSLRIYEKDLTICISHVFLIVFSIINFILGMVQLPILESLDKKYCKDSFPKEITWLCWGINILFNLKKVFTLAVVVFSK